MHSQYDVTDDNFLDSLQGSMPKSFLASVGIEPVANATRPHWGRGFLGTH